MGIAMAVNDIIRVRIACMTEDQLGLNTLHYRINSITGGDTLIDDLPTAFADVAGPLLANCITGWASVVGCGCAIVLPVERATIEFKGQLTGGDIQGSFGDDRLPGQLSGLIRFRREIAGRSARGRNFIPFPALNAADVGTGYPTAAYKTALIAYMNTISPNIVVPVKTHSVTMQLGIRGKFTGWGPVVESTAVQKWATQRRRGNFGPTNTNPFA